MSQGRRPLIAGNWKMNGGLDEVDSLAGDLAGRMAALDGPPAFELALCPPFPLLPMIAARIEESGIALGAQDCHGAEKGAHTGDTSANLLAEVGCAYVIVGHSERRADHKETDDQVRRKAEAAQAAGLCAVVCVGETEAERDAGRAVAVVVGQVAGSVPEGSTSRNLVVAYEPVWAIGTGKTATPQDAQDMHAAIRAALGERFGAEAAAGIRILYGGSMKPDNAAGLLALADVDGGLIGGASLKADDFWAIAEAVR
ncbi:MAG: triose-phosphate isomerase [Rhodospirillales bacterium CG15_BIG_FIL_POST_REV_8_21_14_020_66_15]|nr:MAG: triose-phosphate isomerase [Rhodospirillales bacterium CG15_BIG_FIL_POST_REV_8_21_14_020_66_15]